MLLQRFVPHTKRSYQRKSHDRKVGKQQPILVAVQLGIQTVPK